MINVRAMGSIGDAISQAVSAAIQAIVDGIKIVFFGIVKLLFTALDAFMDIIFKLAGFSNLDSGENILSMFFSNTNDGTGDQISRLYLYMCMACAVLMLFFAVIQVIRQDFFSEAGPQSHAPIFKRMFVGLLWFIAIPPVFIFAVDIVAGLIAALMKIDAFSSVGSMSQAIFEMCLETPEWVRNANARGDAIRLDPIPHWSAITARDFIALTNMYDFNILVFIAVLIMTFYSMFMLSFGLVKRVVSLVFLYVMGPIAISQSVIDGGARMKKWQSNVVGKFTSVFGTIISLVILFMFITNVVEDLNFFNVSALSGLAAAAATFANTIIKALFIIVAFDMVRKGEIISDFISNLTVSESEGVAKMASSYGKTAVNVAKMPVAAAQGVTKAVQKTAGTIRGFHSLRHGGEGNEYTDNFRLPGILNADNWRDDVHKKRAEEIGKQRAEARKQRAALGLAGGSQLNFATSGTYGDSTYKADAAQYIEDVKKSDAVTTTSQAGMRAKTTAALNMSTAKRADEVSNIRSEYGATVSSLGVALNLGSAADTTTTLSNLSAAKTTLDGNLTAAKGTLATDQRALTTAQGRLDTEQANLVAKQQAFAAAQAAYDAAMRSGTPPTPGSPIITNLNSAQADLNAAQVRVDSEQAAVVTAQKTVTASEQRVVDVEKEIEQVVNVTEKIKTTVVKTDADISTANGIMAKINSQDATSYRGDRRSSTIADNQETSAKLNTILDNSMPK